MWLITLIDLWILKNPCIPGIKPKEEDITIVNIYAPNIGAQQYVKQMLTSMKGEINNNTVIVGDFHTPLTPMDRSTIKPLYAIKKKVKVGKLHFK